MFSFILAVILGILLAPFSMMVERSKKSYRGRGRKRY